MQSLPPRVPVPPTEPGPRSECPHCGNHLPRPTGEATFAYGIGAVGYQSCDACGAKWRYVWQEAPPAPRASGRNWILAVLGGAVVVLVVAALAFALPRSSAKKGTGSRTKTTTDKPTATTTPKNAGAVQTLADYERITVPTVDARTALMHFFSTKALVVPQVQVNDRVNSFAGLARSSDAALLAGEWSEKVAADIKQRVADDETFLKDIELIPVSTLLYSTSFTDRLEAEARTLTDDERALRRDLAAESTK